MELRSLRLDFLFTIFFLRSFSIFFFFFLHLPSHSLLPSPQKPKTVLPSLSKSISENPKPKITISIGTKIQTPHLNPFLKISNPFLKIPNPNQDFDIGGIFSIVGLCFQFFLHLNPFLKIRNPNHDLNWSKNY